MKLRKLLVVLLAILTVLALPAITAEATQVYTGTCGSSLKWQLVGNELTISGTGDMSNYSTYSDSYKSPWYKHASKITTVIIEEGVTSIGDYAFYGCSQITTVKIPASLKKIGTAAFFSVTAVKDIYITDLSAWCNITHGESSDWLQNSTSLKNLYLNDVLVANLEIPNGVTSIPNNAFCRFGCITDISIPASVEYIGTNSFSGCDKVTELTLSEGLKSINSNGVALNIQTLTVPKTVYYMGAHSFNSLTHITFAGQTKLEGWWDAKQLTEITFLGDAPVISSFCFEYLKQTFTAYYPFCNSTWTSDKLQQYGGKITWKPLNNGEHSYVSGACEYCGAKAPLDSGTCGDNLIWVLSADGVLTISGSGKMNNYYDGDSPFSQYSADIKEVIIEDGVSSIGYGAFQSCSNLVTVTIPSSVTTIGGSAFKLCTSLSSVDIPDGVTSIEYSAFYRCSSLVSVSIPNSVKTIGGHAFYWCDKLSSVTIPDSVKTLGEYAFYRCNSLSTVSIPGSISSIGSYAFYMCYSLSSVSIEEGVTVIGAGAFRDCTKLVSIDIPDTVTSILGEAFRGCESLTSVEIPDGVKSIGFQTFCNCSSLTSIIIPDTVYHIDNYAFTGCDSIEALDIPAGVTHIGSKAFSSCDSLKIITFNGSAPSYFGEDAFSGNTLTVHYPNNLPGWKDIITQKYGATEITWNAYTLLIDLEGATMTLSNSLSMNFVVDMDLLLPEESYYAVITRTYADGSKEAVTVTCPQSEWNVYDADKNQKYFSYHGIAAKEMIDELTVEIFNADGTSASNVWKDSPRAYALRAIKDEEAEAEPNEEKLALYVDMLNYGAAAQTYFGYKTDDLANKDLKDTQKAYATGEVTTENKQKTPGSNYIGASLALFNEIRLNFVFDASVINTGMYAEATYTDHDNNPRTITIPGTDFLTEGKNGLMVSVTGMAVADYNQAVTCTVYNADKTVVIAATDSVGSYLGRALQVETHELFDMILKFCYSAYNAFH